MMPGKGVSSFALLFLLAVALAVLAFPLVRAEDAKEGTAEPKAAQKMEPKKPKGKCKVLSISGFPHNDWINTWVVLWKHNQSCSEGTRKCFVKNLDPVPDNLRILAHKVPGMDFALPTLNQSTGFLKWAADHWYITGDPERPEQSVYAQIESRAKAPPSGMWEVYNGTEMVPVNVSIRCIGGSIRAQASVVVEQYGVYSLLAVLVLYLLTLLQALFSALFGSRAPEKVADGGKPKKAAAAPGKTD
eukprot:RCo033117